MSNKSLVEDLLVNENLVYEMPSNSSAVAKKAHKLFFFDKTDFKGTESSMQITLNSGADFINPKNSYLSFNVKCFTDDYKTTPTNTVLNFGVGSAVNLFSEIVIRSRDGQELERVRDINVLSQLRARYRYSQDWFNNIGSQQGYLGSTSDGDIVSSDGSYTKDEQMAHLIAGMDVVIPLSEICGLFDSDKILPPHLMAGLRIELSLTPFATAFVSAGDASTYIINNPHVRLETVMLTDSVMASLTKTAANDKGIVLTIKTFDLTRSNPTGTSVNIEVRRNVGQLLGSYVQSRAADQVELKTVDSMRSEEHLVASYRFRLGSDFQPTSVVDKKVEHYSLSQIAFDKNRKSYMENSVSRKSYLEGGQALIANDWERSSIDLSGVSISNSKVLAFEAKYDTAVPRVINTWIQFTRVFNIFLTNVSVSD